MNNIKNHFPFFKNNKKTIYLDSAASALKVDAAIDAEQKYLKTLGVNAERGMYKEGIASTDCYSKSRKKIAEFINADFEEVVFTSGTTEALNLIANSLSKTLSAKDNVLITIQEHNSSYLPWYENSIDRGFKLNTLNLNKDFQIDKEEFLKKIDKKTKVFITSLASNVLGNIINLDEILKICKEKNIIVIGDAAQAIVHEKIDVKKIGIDFLAFSGHKLYATNGIGVLYAKKESVKNIISAKVGGGGISSYDNDKPLYKKMPYFFEPGTPPVAQAVSLAAAVKFLEENNFNKLIKEEKDLVKYTAKEIEKIENVNLINNNPDTPIFSFTVNGVHPHDIAFYLAENNVAIRSGFHCAERLLKHLGYESGCLRASFGIYTDKEDVDAFISVLKEGIRFFKKEGKI